MKKTALFVCLMLIGFVLTACCLTFDHNIDVQMSTMPQETAFDIPTEPIIEPDTENIPEPVTQPPETMPEHSPYYIPGVSVEDVILYFNEICLDAEFVTDGDPTRLQKWVVPIYYKIYQSPTQEDLACLNKFTSWLNSIPGFPGIYETDDPTVANLNIYFCSHQQMIDILGENFVAMDGGVTFWYNGNDQIYRANICYRTDLDQYLRNSVILEEIYNGLGPVQDTALREDSIIYAGYTQPQTLTEMDELILKLLYNPAMQCGMNSEACQRVIRSLYY